ncbi:MAG: ATP-binding protein [Wenzhouxiangellaceae bacterium]
MVDWLTISDGLPNPNIEALARDRYGYLWIGTQGGLVRHEGTRLNVLRHDPDRPGSLPGNNILSMMAAGDGSLWAAISGKGIVRIENLTVEQHWRPVADGGVLEGHFVWAMTEDCDGTVWAAYASGGLVRLDPETGRAEHFEPGSHGLPEAGFNLDIATDRHCRTWLVRADGLWQVQHDDQVRFESGIVADETGMGAFLTLHLDEEQAWIGSARGLLHIDPGLPGDVAPELVRTWQLDESVSSVAPDGRGRLWLGLRRGLELFDPDSNRPPLRAAAGLSGDLESIHVTDLLLGAEGELWIAAQRAGLGRLPPGWRGFRSVRDGGDADDLKRITVLFADSDGSYWVADDAAGVRQLAFDSPQTMRVLQSQPVEGPIVIGLVPDGDEIWTLQRRLLQRIDISSGHALAIMERASQTEQLFTFLARADEGRLWLGAHGAELLLLDRNGKPIDRWAADAEGSRQLPDTSVSAIRRGPDGTWWLLGERSVFRQHADGAFSVVHRSDQSQLLAMEFQEQSVWLASDSVLERFDLVNGRLQSGARYTAGDGLPAGRVQALVPGTGELWLLMSIGLARLDLSSGQFRLFSVREGLPLSEFNEAGAVLFEDGRFLAATNNGLLLVDPDAIAPALQPPPVRITDIRAGDEVFQFDPRSREPLRLGWRQNSLEASFVALSYLDPSRNRYRLRLTGWERDWRELIGQETQFYSNLPGGEYVLEVQAANVDGIWNLEGDRRRIVIDHPPWRSGPAWVGYALIALAMTGFGWRSVHQRRLRREALRLARDRQQLAERQRLLLERLNQSLEPEPLAAKIADALLGLTAAPECQFGFVDPEFPDRLYGSGSACRKRERAQFDQALAANGPGMVLRLGHGRTLAAVWLPQSEPGEVRIEHARIELFTQTTGQVLENARLLLEVRHHAQQAQQASAAKSEFLATMSHEIRTPLHGLLGTMELLEHEGIAPEQFEMLRTMRGSGRQLQRILNDVLDLSRIEAGHIELCERAFDLSRLLERVVELHAANAAASGLDLRLRISSSLPVMAIGDDDRIAQVLGNLVNNAIKFTHAGSVEIEVRIDADNRLVLAVSDTGPGIQPEVQRELFEPFTQAESAVTRKHSGSGLGLAICRRLVDAMHGELDLVSRPGRGSRFTVRLPLAGMSPQPPFRIGLLEGLGLAAALSPADLRVLRRLARRWGLRIVRPENPGDMPVADALLFTPEHVEPGVLRQWREQGRTCWQLGRSSEDGPVLRRPLTESRLIGALLDLRFSRRCGD